MRKGSLKRHKPLQNRSGLLGPYKGLKRGKGLRKVASERKDIQAVYEGQKVKEKMIGTVLCSETGRPVWVETRERHHVARRLGKRLLIYAFITPRLHRWIEANSKKAREIGWLRNVGQGYPVDKNQPQPWKPGTLIGQDLLDEIEGRKDSAK